ncbi:glycoside hydrolase family 28 protein [Aestuariivivens sediminicola]|uniref:glycoside hydrolase family 28 protein n=1 Tax=Aestuariivivens sediminicola TaxID=2913560 RepID=UPI001F5658A7|nr:glycosyl hydrolase family 28 protein [Aestuariivivens sediminicola]
MITIDKILFLSLVILCTNCESGKEQSSRSIETEKAIPVEGVDVTDYGVSGDGKTLNTEHIQGIIDSLEQAGGGTLIFPKGTFLSGSLEIKSNITIYLREEAVLMGTADPYQYRKGIGNLAFLFGGHAENIAILGKGSIDGQGRALALAIDSLHHIGERIDPNYNLRRMRPHESFRPELLNLKQCKNITINGVTLKNSAGWLQTIEQCNKVVYDSVKVYNRAYWNNDGFDIVDCHNVRITNCNVDAADDGICLKSHSADHFNDQIYISNCTVRSSASAIKFGTASLGGFKNVTIEDIEVFDTFRSAIAIESVDGGVIENIKVNNVVAKNTGNAIFIRLGHRSGERPGSVKHINLKNINVEVPFGRPDINYDLRGPEVDFFHNPFPASIAGIPEYRIEDVHLENIQISYPGRATKGMAYVPLSRLEQVPERIENYPEFSMFGELPAWGFYVRHAKGITFKNISLTLQDSDYRPAFVFDDVIDLQMDKIELPIDKKDQIVLKDVDDSSISLNEELVKTIYKQL